MQTFKTWNEDWGLSQRQNTSRNTQSAAHQSLCAFYQTCKKVGNSNWRVPAKKPEFTSARTISTEMKIFQIIRELSGFSLWSEQFNNDVKVSVVFSFPFLPSSLQSFFHKSKTQKTRKSQNEFASNAFTSITERGTLSLWHNKHEVPKAELNGHWLVRPTISTIDALISSCAGQKTTWDPPAEWEQPIRKQQLSQKAAFLKRAFHSWWRSVRTGLLLPLSFLAYGAFLIKWFYHSLLSSH